MNNIVTPESVVRGTKDLSFRFEFNRVDEAVNQTTTDYVMDINGFIYENNKSSKNTSVTILGGDSRFLFEKANRAGIEYLTTKQKIAISNILQQLAKYTAFANVNSDDDYLHQIVNSLYGGYKN